MPQVQVAKIRAQMESEGLQASARQAKYLSDIQVSEAKTDREQALVMKRIELEIEKMKMAAAQNISIQDINAQLAMTTQKLTVQSALSQVDRADAREALTSKPVISPPTEPAGRADDGRSFEQ
jgi:hypothetical protein